MLKFPGAWRFKPPADNDWINQSIPDTAVREFREMIDKTATQGSRQDILEHFKGYFCTAVGEPHVWSSSESWADTDLWTYMNAAAKNAPLFLEAFHDACESLRGRDDLFAPDASMINEVCNQHSIGYPLIADVLKLCFGVDALPTGKSVEDLFADAQQGGNYEPMEVLVERLMEADYRIAQKLATSTPSNPYREFFKAFSDAQILTFNYDSLPEIFLSQQGRWHPEDGYGVPVRTELAFGMTPAPDARSSSRVTHLHGSACVFTIESEILGDPTEWLSLSSARKTFVRIRPRLNRSLLSALPSNDVTHGARFHRRASYSPAA